MMGHWAVTRTGLLPPSTNAARRAELGQSSAAAVCSQLTRINVPQTTCQPARLPLHSQRPLPVPNTVPCPVARADGRQGNTGHCECAIHTGIPSQSSPVVHTLLPHSGRRERHHGSLHSHAPLPSWRPAWRSTLPRACGSQMLAVPAPV